MKAKSRFSSCLTWAISASTVLGALIGDCLAQDDIQIRFGRDIRPLLSDRCFLCHGPDRAMQKAGLRLDSFDEATADRDGEAAIVPGDPNASLLYQRIISTNSRKRMPPAKSGKHQLEPEEIERIRLWIESGAEYEDHWAFTQLTRPEIPSVDQPEGGVNEVDYFILD